MVKVEDIAVNVLTSVITTLIIIFLLIPLLGIPIPVLKETETTKKYYYPYVMPVELEGDYSDWTIYDTQDDTDVGTPSPFDAFALFNTEETVAFFHHDDFVKKYDVATKTLGVSLLTPYYSTGLEAGQQIATKSVLGRYVVFLDDSYDRIHIGKDGVIVKTVTKTDLGVADIRGVSVSLKGKYVVVVAPNKWIVLVGS